MNQKFKTINRIIFVLSIAGLIMGAYVLQSFLRQTGVICLTGGGCDLVRTSPISYPFGIPVPAIGVAGYTGLAILAFLQTLSTNQERRTKNLLKAMLGIAIFGICFVTWFTFMELFVIHGICMWCAISAVNMYVIFGLVVYSLRRTPKSS